MNVLILDTETTGVSNEDDVIELSYLPIPFNIKYGFGFEMPFYDLIGSLRSRCNTSRYKPDAEIHPKAYAVHGIHFRDLIKCPSSKTLVAPQGDYYVGHKISFDHRMLGKPDVKLICTEFLSRRLHKQHPELKFENYQLDTLVEYFYGDRIEKIRQKYHSAELDVIKVYLLLEVFFKEFFKKVETFEELYNVINLMKNK